jgi:hypothetical protein
MDLKVGDLVRRYKFDCVEGPRAPLVGIIIKIVDQAPYHRMIHVLFGDRIRRYSEIYGAQTSLKVISETHREKEAVQEV